MLVAFLLSLHLAQNLAQKSYFCSSEGEGGCTFVSFQPQLEEEFKFVSDRSMVVQRVQFNSSLSSNFSSKLCDTFGSTLRELRLVQMGIEEVDDVAFFNCKRLAVLDLTDNSLRKLSNTLLMGNWQLVWVSFRENFIKSVEREAFRNTKLLETLDLSGNLLKTFETSTVLPKLKSVSLSSNRLTELDVEELASKAPKLEILHIADNNFDCSDLREIIDDARRKKITLPASASELDQGRERGDGGREPVAVGGLECYENDVERMRGELQQVNMAIGIVCIVGVFVSLGVVAIPITMFFLYKRIKLRSQTVKPTSGASGIYSKPYEY